MAIDASGCVVLVPYLNHVDPLCEAGLDQLQQRGYTIQRIHVRSPWDSPGNFITAKALAEGFEGLVWIDPEIGFVADDVDRLRTHDLSIVVGLVAEPGRREFRCEFLATMRSVTFAADC